MVKTAMEVWLLLYMTKKLDFSKLHLEEAICPTKIVEAFPSARPDHQN